jgi:hypothetical protein
MNGMLRAMGRLPLLLFLMTLPLITGMQQKGSDAPVPSGLCIEHIGASDKPIFPIVIVNGPNAEHKCLDRLGNRVKDTATYLVSEAEARRTVDALKQLVRIVKAPVDSREYGTFRLTMLDQGEAKEVVLGRKDFVILIDRILLVLDNEKLNAALQSTRARLQI